MSKQEQNTFNDGEVSLEDLINGSLFEEQSEDSAENTDNLLEDLETQLNSSDTEEVVETTETEKTEELEELVTEEQEKKDKEVTETIMEDTETSAFQKAQTLIEMGLLDDIVVATSEEEEGVNLSEMKNLTDEQLEFVLKNKEEQKQKELSEKFIPKEGLKENQLKLVEMLKNGLSVEEVTQNPNQYLRRPFEGLDLDNEKDQVKIAIQEYTRKGLDKEDIIRAIKGKREDGLLADFAKSTYDIYQQAFDQNLEQKNQELIQKRQEEENRVQEIRKNLSSTLKEAKLKDNISKKLIDGVTKSSEDGIKEVEKKFKELLQNPVENYETLLHILDPNAFKEIYNIKTNKKVNSEVLRIVNATPKGAAKSPQKKDKEEFSDYETKIANMLILGKSK